MFRKLFFEVSFEQKGFIKLGHFQVMQYVQKNLKNLQKSRNLVPELTRAVSGDTGTRVRTCPWLLCIFGSQSSWHGRPCQDDWDPKMHKSHGQVLTRVPVSPDTARVSSGTKFLDFWRFFRFFWTYCITWKWPNFIKPFCSNETSKNNFLNN